MRRLTLGLLWLLVACAGGDRSLYVGPSDTAARWARAYATIERPTTTTTSTTVAPISEPAPTGVNANTMARAPSNNEDTSPPLGGSTAGGSQPHGVWDCIRAYESGGTTDPNGDYSDANGGAYQFLDSTWQSMGYTGAAEDHPPEVQDAAAVALQARSGWGQWTTASLCGVY